MTFYFWGEFEFIWVLVTSIVINFIAGLIIDKVRSKTALTIAVSLNLLILIYYKYVGFLINSLLGNIDGTNSQIWWNNIHLPLGISFFTFQGISYLFDIYRKEAEVEKNIFNLALYISMFPQLVAGPIVRFKTIAESITNRTHTLTKFVHGCSLFIVGLSYKILLANNFALVADQIFNLPPENLNISLAWLGVLSYTMQIYFDFNGYSIMAIGLGYLFGFKFPINFNYPYISRSITEFWRRWHITLSVWFRDYLYIPLGGNRQSKVRTYINLIIVFALCGIWHGASWIFLLWGLYQGFFLVIERLGMKKWLENLPSFMSHLYTIFVFVIGWLLFRSTDLKQFAYYFRSLFGTGDFEKLDISAAELMTPKIILAFIFGITLSTPIVFKTLFISKDNNLISISTPTEYKVRMPIVWYLMLLFLLLISVANLCNQTYNPFIYFRF